MDINDFILTDGEVHWIATTLMINPDLVCNKDRLCGALGLYSQIEDIKVQVGLDRSGSYGFLSLTLSTWISMTGSTSTLLRLVNILRQENFNSSADAIYIKYQNSVAIFSSDAQVQSQYASGSFTVNSTINKFHSNSTWFDVPERINQFTGRIQELDQLHNSLLDQASEDTNSQLTVITALSGIGGVGKTTLSIHYAWKYVLNFYANVVWINGASEATLTDSFNRLAEELNISKTELELNLLEMAKLVYKYFCKSEELTLFIFDNVENYDTTKDYLPTSTPYTKRPYVLVTSRCRNWNDKTELIELDVFKKEDSIQFLTKYLNLKTEIERKCANLLSDMLQNLPLAIRQAGAYIKMQHLYNHSHSHNGLACEMQDYLIQFRKNAKELLSFDYCTVTADKFVSTTYTTWNVTLKMIKSQNPLAVRVMELISYLNPDNIPVELFEYYRPTGTLLRRSVRNIFYRSKISRVKFDVHQAIQLLADYSMITKNGNKGMFNVHRIVQKVVKFQVEEKFKFSRLEETVTLIKIPLKMRNFDYFERVCLLHSLSIWDYINSVNSNLANKYNHRLIELIHLKQDNSIPKYLHQLSCLLINNKYINAFECFREFRTTIEISPTNYNAVQQYLYGFAIILAGKIHRLCMQTDFGSKLFHLQIFQQLNEILKELGSSRDTQSLDFAGFLKLVEVTYDIANKTKQESVRDPIFIETQNTCSFLYNHLIHKCAYEDISKIGVIIITICGELNRLQNILEFMGDFKVTLKLFSTQIGENKSSFECDSDLVHLVQVPNCLTSLSKHSNAQHFELRLLQEAYHSYDALYEFNKKRNNYVTQGVIGRHMIPCLEKLNKFSRILEIVQDFSFAFETHYLTVPRCSLSGLQNNPDFLLSDSNSLDYLNELFISAKNSKSKDLKVEIIELILQNYKTIHKLSCRGKDYTCLSRSISGIIDCLIQVNKTTEIPNAKLATEFKRELRIALSLKANKLNVLYSYALFEVPETLLKCVMHINIPPVQDYLIKKSTQIYKLLYNYTKYHQDYSMLSKVVIHLCQCFIKLKTIPELLKLITDFKTIPEFILKGNWYYTLVLDVSDALFDIAVTSNFKDTFREDLLMQSFHIYDQILAVMRLATVTPCPYCFDLTNITHSTVGLIQCLTELNSCDEILNLVSGIGSLVSADSTFSEDGKIKFSNSVIDSLMLSAEHDHCTNYKNEFIEHASCLSLYVISRMSKRYEVLSIPKLNTIRNKRQGLIWEIKELN